MKQTAARQIPFSQTWLSKAKAYQKSDSWVADLVQNIPGTGKLYLDTLKNWYRKFPVTSLHLRNRLDSFNTADHLGGVNELYWWQVMQKFGWNANPIPVGKTKRPDFQISAPAKFFCEVTTLNISTRDIKAMRGGKGVPLDHLQTIGRLLRKAGREKKDQLAYAENRGFPAVLVVFDYTVWSGFATQFYKELKTYLLGSTNGFASLPDSLSAIVYMEKKFLNGRFAMSLVRSAAYHNPYAAYPLSCGVFAVIRQFHKGLERKPVRKDSWLYI